MLTDAAVGVVIVSDERLWAPWDTAAKDFTIRKDRIVRGISDSEVEGEGLI